ncbi:cysteine hydrolase family protein [Halalkalibacter nanhaiisediminis]|uniref:Nicotinamidase-related amidase n=1 Tax=Halalkalibacter nanhaiisediminis TaxID=688079 RepID=A0A562Q896_9BACI|nr:isochorismatase family cysteine hydrolase [Halalkalibacter nanhaiisediminis]TWI52938.1 nicotinamidase-related amidase [Halalkalibacter nanhaiisediminis]
MVSSQSQGYALLIIDMINDLEFDDGNLLFPHALEAAKHISALKKRLKTIDIPVIYVNDNYGRWQSDFRSIVDYCMESDVRGRPIANLLKPDADDYFVLKPQFSGFFATPLELLLEHLNVDTLIITGVAGNMCVQFTANDAYMRHFKLMIPADCIASNTVEANQEAVHLMKDVLKADTSLSKDILNQANEKN